MSSLFECNQWHMYFAQIASRNTLITTYYVVCAVLSPDLFAVEDEIGSGRLAKWCDELLSKLQPMHYNVFVYLMLFFKEALKMSEENGLQASVCCCGFPTYMQYVLIRTKCGLCVYLCSCHGGLFVVFLYSRSPLRRTILIFSHL